MWYPKTNTASGTYQYRIFYTEIEAVVLTPTEDHNVCYQYPHVIPTYDEEQEQYTLPTQDRLHEPSEVLGVLNDKMDKKEDNLTNLVDMKKGKYPEPKNTI